MEKRWRRTFGGAKIEIERGTELGRKEEDNGGENEVITLMIMILTIITIIVTLIMIIIA